MTYGSIYNRGLYYGLFNIYNILVRIDIIKIIISTTILLYFVPIMSFYSFGMIVAYYKRLQKVHLLFNDFYSIQRICSHVVFHYLFESTIKQLSTAFIYLILFFVIIIHLKCWYI